MTKRVVITAAVGAILLLIAAWTLTRPGTTNTLQNTSLPAGDDAQVRELADANRDAEADAEAIEQAVRRRLAANPGVSRREAEELARLTAGTVAAYSEGTRQAMRRHAEAMGLRRADDEVSDKVWEQRAAVLRETTVDTGQIAVRTLFRAGRPVDAVPAVSQGMTMSQLGLEPRAEHDVTDVTAAGADVIQVDLKLLARTFAVPAPGTPRPASVEPVHVPVTFRLTYARASEFEQWVLIGVGVVDLPSGYAIPTFLV